jgi:hypothetical protein
MNGTKQVSLVEASEAEALAPVEPDPIVGMFERLARDPSVDVEKLQRLIDMQKDVMAVNARAAFNAAYSRMQPQMPAITEKGEIAVKGVVRSRYAKLEDIQAAVKPILAQFGFAIRHRTEWPDGGKIRIVGILTHEQGHSEESVFEAPMDRSEYRTDIQSQGSTVSYGRRYTTIDLLNIETRGKDDDGSTSGRPQPPDGYDDWMDNMAAVADEGAAKFDAAWAKSNAEYKNFTVTHNKAKWAELKARAAAVGKGGR